MDAQQRQAAAAYDDLVRAELAQLETLRAFVRLMRDDYERGLPDGGNALEFCARAEVLLDAAERLIADAHTAAEARALLTVQAHLEEMAMDQALLQVQGDGSAPRA